MNTKNVLKVSDPAAITANPCTSAARCSDHSVRTGSSASVCARWSSTKRGVSGTWWRR